MKIAGPNAEGVVCAYPWNPDRKDPKLDAFREAFRKRFDEEPETYAAHAYDGMNMLIWAIQIAGLNRAKIRDVLAYRTQAVARRDRRHPAQRLPGRRRRGVPGRNARTGPGNTTRAPNSKSRRGQPASAARCTWRFLTGLSRGCVVLRSILRCSRFAGGFEQGGDPVAVGF